MTSLFPHYSVFIYILFQTLDFKHSHGLCVVILILLFHFCLKLFFLCVFFTSGGMIEKITLWMSKVEVSQEFDTG